MGPNNTSEVEARMLVTITPAGLEGFFAATFVPASEGAPPSQATPEMMGRLKAAAEKYGIAIG